MPIETCKKKIHTILQVPRRTERPLRPAKKASIMTVPPPSNTNPDKAPVWNHTVEDNTNILCPILPKKMSRRHLPRLKTVWYCHPAIMCADCALQSLWKAHSIFRIRSYGILCSDVTSFVNDAGVNTEEVPVISQIMRNQYSEMAKFSELWGWSDVSHFGGCFVTRHGCGLRTSRGKGMTLGIIVTCHISFVVSS